MYCVCTYGLLVHTHCNFKSNVYRIHIKNSGTHPFFNVMCTLIKCRDIPGRSPVLKRRIVFQKGPFKSEHGPFFNIKV